MAKVAIELEHAVARRKQDGTPGRTLPHVIARGDGWTVADVLCTCGPQDHPYEERHSHDAIAVVCAGSFEYRSPVGRALMTSGSLMLGNHGHDFECAHRHGDGDRCVSFWYTPDYFEQLASDAGARRRSVGLQVARLPPLRDLSPLVARIGAAVANDDRTAAMPWEEVAVNLAARTVRLAAGMAPEQHAQPPNAEARVTRVVRGIDRYPGAGLSLAHLARQARLSPYHFLRTFERLTGITPHQYVLRVRLREAAARLLDGTGKVLEIALDCGFGDISNFNRAFRTEFGMSPRAFRASR